MIKGISSIQRPGFSNPSQLTKSESQKGAFGAILQQKLDQGTQPIQFSKHAIARAEERGIELTDTLIDKLTDSVEKAQEKGATNILAFDATQAFIINVPYGRVITTMSQDEMKENIFTNIDGAVLL
ncbi:MAG: TIGR02530 family flagellar biosynthesis protein [Lawsonibacter sp.]|nr:TIGR02530 family flagellar biosynthesis protein [Lawsonibacter sp.]